MSLENEVKTMLELFNKNENMFSFMDDAEDRAIADTFFQICAPWRVYASQEMMAIHICECYLTGLKELQKRGE